MNKFSFVLPLKIANNNFLYQMENGPAYGNDAERMINIQLPTFRKYLDIDSLDKFYIICLPDEKKIVQQYITQYYPEFPFVFIIESELIKLDKFFTSGHLKQQLLKFEMAKHIDTSYYIVLDADVFLTRPFSYHNLFHDKKIIFTSLRDKPEKPHSKPFWINSMKFLFDSEEMPPIKKFISVTPEILITDEVKQLIQYIENKYNKSYIEALLDYVTDHSLQWSEYSLYWLYLAFNNKLDNLYSCDGPSMFGNELWRYTEFSTMNRVLDDFINNLEIVFDRSKIGHWCWNPHQDYYFSLCQSNIQQLNTDKLAKRIQEIINK